MLKPVSICSKDIFDIKQEDDGKLHSYHPIHESVTCGILLAIVGGFLDAYTFIGRGGVFANAQTGNIVCLSVYVAQRQWKHAFTYFPPIIAFIVGVFVSAFIKNHSRFKLTWARAVLIFEIIILFIIGLLPYTIPDMIVNVTISFVASLQVSSFRKLVDSPYCSTMTTGNLRSASDAAYAAFIQKDRAAAIRTIRYAIIIFSFISGAFAGGIATVILGPKAVWITAVILICTIVLFHMDNQEEPSPNTLA